MLDTLLERYVIHGGFMMIPLVFCSILTLGLTLQGAVRLRRKRVTPPELLVEARSAGPSAGRRSFIMALRASPSPLGRAVWIALKDFAAREKAPELTEVDALVDEATAEAVDEMYDGLSGLSTIYTIAPLLGLLGTILGMMRAFHDFAQQQVKSVTNLSTGIQEALITTLWGLGVAVLSYLAIQWLQSRIRRYERFDLPVAVRELIVSLYATPLPPAPEQGVGTITAAARRAAQTDPQP